MIETFLAAREYIPSGNGADLPAGARPRRKSNRPLTVERQVAALIFAMTYDEGKGAYAWRPNCASRWSAPGNRNDEEIKSKKTLDRGGLLMEAVTVSEPFRATRVFNGAHAEQVSRNALETLI
jgi:hypothetical protein